MSEQAMRELEEYSYLNREKQSAEITRYYRMRLNIFRAADNIKLDEFLERQEKAIKDKGIWVGADYRALVENQREYWKSTFYHRFNLLGTPKEQNVNDMPMGFAWGLAGIKKSQDPNYLARAKQEAIAQQKKDSEYDKKCALLYKTDVTLEHYVRARLANARKCKRLRERHDSVDRYEKNTTDETLEVKPSNLHDKHADPDDILEARLEILRNVPVINPTADLTEALLEVKQPISQDVTGILCLDKLYNHRKKGQSIMWMTVNIRSKEKSQISMNSFLVVSMRIILLPIIDRENSRW